MRFFTRTIRQLIIFAGCYASYTLPIYGFAILFRQPIDDFTGIYLTSLFVFSLFGFLLSFIFLWLTPKYWHNLYYKIIVLLFYTLFYIQACINTAYDHRVVFGNTWQTSEILSALVLPHWYFYVLGLVGFVWHYFAQSLILLLPAKKTTSDKTQHLSS